MWKCDAWQCNWLSIRRKVIFIPSIFDAALSTKIVSNCVWTSVVNEPFIRFMNPFQMIRFFYELFMVHDHGSEGP